MMVTNAHTFFLTSASSSFQSLLGGQGIEGRAQRVGCRGHSCIMVTNACTSFLTSASSPFWSLLRLGVESWVQRAFMCNGNQCMHLLFDQCILFILVSIEARCGGQGMEGR